LMDSYDEFMEKYLAKKWRKAVKENNEPLKQAITEVIIEAVDEKRDEWGYLLYRKPVQEESEIRQPFNVKDRTPSAWISGGVRYILRRDYPPLFSGGQRIREFKCNKCGFTDRYRGQVEIHLEVVHDLWISTRPDRGCHGCHRPYRKIFKAKKWDDYTHEELVLVHHAKCKSIQERIKNKIPVEHTCHDVYEFDLLSLDHLDQILIEESNIGFGMADMYHQFKPIYIDKITTAYNSDIMRAIMRHRR